MSIIGTQNLLTGSHVKTTRYCIEVATSAIYLKLIDAHRRLTSDLEPIEWLEEVSKTSPMCNYRKRIFGYNLKSCCMLDIFINQIFNFTYQL